MSEQLDVDRKRISEFVLPAWEGRRKSQGYVKGHKKTRELQLEFVLGAISIMDEIRNDKQSCVTPQIYVNAIRGE
jgi:hypothetical protein